MRALICFSLLCCFDAFSSREPISTSLENAICCFDAFSSREPVSTSLENAMSCFDAFSSRKPFSTSPESALSVTRYRRGERGHVAFRALVENLLSFDHIEYGLRAIGGVVADPFDVLGAEHQMDAERDIARIFHHVGQEFAEQRGTDGVDFLVALPD